MWPPLLWKWKNPVQCRFAILRNTRENLQKHGLLDKVQCLESDVFDSIEEQKFDLIFWNFPFHPMTKSLADMDWLERAVADPGYQHLDKYLRDAHKFLATDGRLLMAFSREMGDVCQMQKLAQKHAWKPNCLDTCMDLIFFLLLENLKIPSGQRVLLFFRSTGRVCGVDFDLWDGTNLTRLNVSVPLFLSVKSYGTGKKDSI